MKTASLRRWLLHRLLHRLLHPGWLIFLACLGVYLANGQTRSAGDATPNSLLALNGLIYNTLHLDAFRGGYLYSLYHSGEVSYFFTEAKNGHLTSSYPIGPAIISYPIYLCIFIVLKLTGAAIDITNPAFEGQRLMFEKLAASIIAAFSGVVFYLLARLKFSRAIALITTFIYAFATQTWVISSQALWQHGCNNLLILSIVLCLFKANRLRGAIQRLLLVNAGLLGGLLWAVRPTNGVFLVAIATYTLYTYRRNSLFVLIGFSSILLSLGWNFYYFGDITGGYSQQYGFFDFSLQQFVTGFLGVLFSPSRGFFVYMPVMILVLPGMVNLFKLRSHQDEQLILCLCFSCLVLMIPYGFFRIWWAGHSYGPRFLTDVLAVFCLCIGYGISRRGWKLFAIALLIMVSTFVQAVGAFGSTNWEQIPLTIDYHTPQVQTHWRFWAVRDTQIERHFQTLLTRIEKAQHPTEVQKLAGKILQVRDEQKRPIKQPLLGKASDRMILKAQVQNTGADRWWGYETGAANLGELRVRVQWLDLTGTPAMGEQRLYVSGKPRPQALANALGLIELPPKPGQYKMRLDLIAEGMGVFSSQEPGSVVELEAQIQ